MEKLWKFSYFAEFLTKFKINQRFAQEGYTINGATQRLAAPTWEGCVNDVYVDVAKKLDVNGTVTIDVENEVNIDVHVHVHIDVDFDGYGDVDFDVVHMYCSWSSIFWSQAYHEGAARLYVAHLLV